MANQHQAGSIKVDLVSNSLRGEGVPDIAMSRSVDRFKMRRTVMDSFYETVRSTPKIGFGTAARSTLPETGDEAPGPGAYQLKSTMFSNPSSTIRSPPSYTIRGREKFGSPDLKLSAFFFCYASRSRRFVSIKSPMVLTITGFERQRLLGPRAQLAIDRTYQLEPGPGHYTMTIVNPREDNAPKYTFPKDSDADRRNSRHQTPGPGQYNLPTGVGKQVLSTKKSYIGFGFGTSNRPDLLLQSTAEVGPGEYPIPGSTGERQVDSRKLNRNGVPFTKAARMGKPCNLEDVPPGPGNYELPAAICGRQGAASPYRSAPSVTLSGREKFGSPFGW